MTMDELSTTLRQQALKVAEQEPELGTLLRRTVLAQENASFEDAVACTVCYRLLLQPCTPSNNKVNSGTAAASPMFCPSTLRALIRESMDSNIIEMGHTMSQAIREDALAYVRRDPAIETVLEVVLFSKGFAALVCHRASFRLWNKRKYTALFLQSQASAVFGLDIHPKTQIGWAIMLDHGTGIVMGETATVGDGCTILHGVTLGGTGKEAGDRHPKIGSNVLIGAGSSLLGNIQVGMGAKIGAGSVVLRPIPPHATAVGSPARIIGHAKEAKPGSDIDETLENVGILHKSESAITVTTQSITSSEELSGDEGASEDSKGSSGFCFCPYREYTRMANLAPPGSLSIRSLHRLLSPLGCTAMEINACFFALDTKNVGHVKLEYFRDKAVSAIVEFTKIDEATARTVVSQVSDETLSKKQ